MPVKRIYILNVVVTQKNFNCNRKTKQATYCCVHYKNIKVMTKLPYTQHRQFEN